MGHRLFFPPSVAGWPGGLAWLDGQSLVARTNFAAWLTEPSTWGGKDPFRDPRRAARPEDARRVARRAGDLAAPRGRFDDQQDALRAPAAGPPPDDAPVALTPRGPGRMNEEEHDALATTFLDGFGRPGPGRCRSASRCRACGGERRSAAEPRADLPILVVVELTGGNDGLNTVIPHADDVYHKSRPTLRIEPEKVLKLDDRVGLHPALKELHRLWDAGDLAVIQGVGYPDPNRSHFALDGDLADRAIGPAPPVGMAGPGRRRRSRAPALPRRAAIRAAGDPRPQGDAPGAGQPRPITISRPAPAWPMPPRRPQAAIPCWSRCAGNSPRRGSSRTGSRRHPRRPRGVTAHPTRSKAGWRRSAA